MFMQDWHFLADELIDHKEADRVVRRYFNETTSDEEFGTSYLEELGRSHPDHADRIEQLLVLPGIGAYVTHWLLDKAGALCR